MLKFSFSQVINQISELSYLQLSVQVIIHSLVEQLLVEVCYLDVELVYVLLHLLRFLLDLPLLDLLIEAEMLLLISDFALEGSIFVLDDFDLYIFL